MVFGKKVWGNGSMNVKVEKIHVRHTKLPQF